MDTGAILLKNSVCKTVTLANTLTGASFSVPVLASVRGIGLKA